MFHTERTEIKPCYGLTLDEVEKNINRLTRYQSNPFAEGYEDGEMCSNLISYNPHAIKVLEERPSLRTSTGLSANPNAGDLVYNYLDMTYRCIWSNESPILDTLLRARGLHPPYEHSYKRHMLSRNPRAINYLMRHPRAIDWSQVSTNPNALDLLEENPDKIDYNYLSRNTNPRAMALLRNGLDKANWRWLSANSNEEAVKILLENQDKIDWYCLSENQCPLARKLMESNLDKLNWHYFCYNPLAVPFLYSNFEKIKWSVLCERSSTKEQFDFIRQHPQHIVWTSISLNKSPRATKLLEENPDKITWKLAITRHDLFDTITTYDYAGIRNSRHDLHQEFHAWAGHPSKIKTKWLDWGFDTYVMDEADVEEEEDEQNK